MHECTALAFDIGAGSGRAILGRFTKKNGFESMEEIHRFENGYLRVNGMLYWDYLRIYRGILDALRLCRKRGLVPDSVGVDAWAQDVSYIATNGEVLSLPRCYRDPVNQRHANQILQDFSWTTDELTRRCGVCCSAITTINQLYYDRIYRSDIFRTADQFLFIPYLMVYLLTGKRCYDVTLSAIGGLNDATTQEISAETAQLLGIRGMMPRRYERSEVIGNTGRSVCEETETKPIPVICTEAHDTTSAVSSIPEQNDFLWISSGSYNMLGAVIRRKESMSQEAIWSAGFSTTPLNGNRICFMSGGTGMYYIQQCMKYWTRQNLQITYPELTDYAVSHRTVRYFRFKDVPEVALDMPKAINNAIIKSGFEAAGTPFELYEAFCNSMAIDNAKRLTELETALNRRLKNIYIIGGGSQADAINIRVAELMQRPIFVGLTEASAIGNLLAQFEGLVMLDGNTDMYMYLRNNKLFALRRFDP